MYCKSDFNTDDNAYRDTNNNTDSVNDTYTFCNSDRISYRNPNTYANSNSNSDPDPNPNS